MMAEIKKTLSIGKISLTAVEKVWLVYYVWLDFKSKYLKIGGGLTALIFAWVIFHWFHRFWSSWC